MDDIEPSINDEDPFKTDAGDFVSINNLSECGKEKLKNNYVPLYLEDEDEIMTSNLNCNYASGPKREFSIINESNNYVDLSQYQSDIEDEEDSDDCVIIDSSPEPINKMPPPLDLPSNTLDKLTPVSKDPCAHNSQYQLDNVVYTNRRENVNTHATPFANALQAEYANVHMQQTFPNYQERDISGYGSLVTSFQEPQLYYQNEPNNIKTPVTTYINMPMENQNYAMDGYNVINIMPSNGLINLKEGDHFRLPTKAFPENEVPMQFRENRNFSQQNYISNRNDAYEKRTKFQQEMKRKRKHDIRQRQSNENPEEIPENVVKNDDVLTGLNWRHGPASYWYNTYKFPEDENVLNHRIKPDFVSGDEPELSIIKSESLGDDDCVLSTWQLVHWEDEIILDIETAEAQIMESNKKYACHAGWIPSSKHRNMAAFQDEMCGEYFGISPSLSTGTLIQTPSVNQWHSVFTLENAQIVDKQWISKIIIDPRNTHSQEPYLLELDLNNECINFDFTNPQQTTEILTAELNTVYLSTSNTTTETISEDKPTSDTIDGALATPHYDDIPYMESRIKKLKILNKITEVTGIHEKPKEQPLEPIQSDTISLIRYSDRDPYAVARDHPTKITFVLDVLDNENGAVDDSLNPLIRHGIQHSFCATQLDPIFFPMTVDNAFLRHMHRTRLSDVKVPMTMLFVTPQPIYNLIDVVKTESEQRQKICQLTGSGDLFFMRAVTDLTASTDHLVLAEYSEEFPPLMMQTGMASRIINYFKGQFNQPVIIPQLPYGELCVVPKIPFLGQLSSNQIFQTLENNMFRAPLYCHRMKNTDYLVIIRTNSISIRRIDDIFVVGQEVPLMEVPAPNSKKAISFLKDFLQVQIIRMFLQSPHDPKRIRHDDIKALFSEQSDSSLRKRLKIFAEYKKAEAGSQGAYWILKPEFQLPTEDELLELISPEECCLYYSMMKGLCRLEDAGYNSKSFMQADPDQQDDDDDVKESHLKIEDEVKVAPWHTTKTFLDAQRNKCYLELIGGTDPTGCGEAFSYAKVSAMGSLFRESLKVRSHGLFESHDPGNEKKKKLKGTDADLRKLTTKKACSLLKEFGISNRDFKKLKRWDIIDLVRQMSTQRANRGDEKAITKFARVAKLSVSGQEDRYRKECQRIFNLQNQVLANDDELTTDDEEEVEVENEDDVEASNCAALRKSNFGKRLGVRGDDIESDLFKPNRSRTDNVSDMFFDSKSGHYKCAASSDNARAILKAKPPVPKAVPKALCIRRQVENKDGSKTTICQTIPWSTIVKIYFKMNEEHKTEYLRTFCGLNKSEEEKKARKKQAEKIRNLKKKQNQKIHYLGQCSIMDSINKIVKMKKYRPSQNNTSTGKINCGACGKPGHMRTSKVCSVYLNSVKKAIHKRPIHWPIRNTITPYPATAKNATSPVILKPPTTTTVVKPPTTTTVVKPPTTATVVKPPTTTTVVKPPTTTAVVKPVNNNKTDTSLYNSSESCKRIDSIIDLVVGSSYQSDIIDVPVNILPQVGVTKEISNCIADIFPIKSIQQSAPELIIDPIQQHEATDHQTEEVSIVNDSYQIEAVEEACNANANADQDILNGLPNDATIPIDNSTEHNLIDLTSKDDDDKVDSVKEFKLERPMEYVTQYSSPAVISTKSQDLSNSLNTTNNLVDNSINRQNSVPVTRCSVGSVKKATSNLNDSKNRGNRRRIDPRVALNHQFEEIYKGLLQIRGFRCFLHPIRKKDFPTYHCIVEKPMDLTKVKMKINKNAYETRQGFLEDIKLIYDNCLKFNGQNSDLTSIARHLMSYVMEQFCVKERKLMRLEKLTNPLMDDDDMVGMRYILEQTVRAMEAVEYSRAFHLPVNRKMYPDYFNIVSQPMDLQTIRKNIDADKYKSREDFLVDANLIMMNCVTYNGPEAPITEVCRKVLDTAHKFFMDRESTFATLESNLRMQSDDASGSHMGPSSCVTADHLSHFGEDHSEDTSMDVDGPLCKRQRLSDSFGDEKVSSVVTTPSVVSNKVRILSDLQLTDSDEEVDAVRTTQETITDISCNRTESEVSIKDNDPGEYKCNVSLVTLPVDENKVRILADLQLTDSDDDLHGTANKSSEDIIPNRNGVVNSATNKVRVMADLELTDSDEGGVDDRTKDIHISGRKRPRSNDDTITTSVECYTDGRKSELAQHDEYMIITEKNQSEANIPPSPKRTKVSELILTNNLEVLIEDCDKNRLDDSINGNSDDRDLSFTVDVYSPKLLSTIPDDVNKLGIMSDNYSNITDSINQDGSRSLEGDVSCSERSKDIILTGSELETNTSEITADLVLSECEERSRDSIFIENANNRFKDIVDEIVKEQNHDDFMDIDRSCHNTNCVPLVMEDDQTGSSLVEHNKDLFVTGDEIVECKGGDGITATRNDTSNVVENNIESPSSEIRRPVDLAWKLDPVHDSSIVDNKPNIIHQSYEDISKKSGDYITKFEETYVNNDQSQFSLNASFYWKKKFKLSPKNGKTDLWADRNRDPVVVDLALSDSEGESEMSENTKDIDLTPCVETSDKRLKLLTKEKIIVDLLLSDSEEDCGTLYRDSALVNGTGERGVSEDQEHNEDGWRECDVPSGRNQGIVNLVQLSSDDEVDNVGIDECRDSVEENRYDNSYHHSSEVSSNIQRLNEVGSFDNDNVDLIRSTNSADSNRTRVIVDLILTDSDDDRDFSDKQNTIADTSFNGSEDSISRSIECGTLEQLTDNDISNENYYQKIDNCKTDDNSANVIFYISDDD